MIQTICITQDHLFESDFDKLINKQLRDDI